jgi:hypothetical protein
MERFADHDGQIYFRLKLEALKTQKLSLAAGRASGQARAWPPPGTWLPIDPWPPLAALVKIEEIASRRGREWRRWRGRRAGRRGRRWQGRRGQGRRGQGRRRRQGRRWQGQRRQRPRRLGRSSCQHHGGMSTSLSRDPYPADSARRRIAQGWHRFPTTCAGSPMRMMMRGPRRRPLLNNGLRGRQKGASQPLVIPWRRIAGTFCSRAATPTGVISSFVRSATMAICNHLSKPTAKWPTLPPQPRDTTN